MTGIRSFVAVDLPIDMRKDIERIQKEIAIEGLRLVRPELVHVTLRFLGDVPESKIEGISQALGRVEVAPFEAQVRGMGAFRGRSIRVVWLGLQGNFQELYRKVDGALSPFGFEHEDRGFNPHITLARVSRPSLEISRQLAPKIAQLSDFELGRFYVERFLLKKSTLTYGGPIYEDLAEFPLRSLE